MLVLLLRLLITAPAGAGAGSGGIKECTQARYGDGFHTLRGVVEEKAVVGRLKERRRGTKKCVTRNKRC